MANEDDELEEFLGIPRKSPKFDPNAGTNTGGDVGKLDQPTVNGTSDDKRYRFYYNIEKKEYFLHFLAYCYSEIQKEEIQVSQLSLFSSIFLYDTQQTNMICTVYHMS